MLRNDFRNAEVADGKSHSMKPEGSCLKKTVIFGDSSKSSDDKFMSIITQKRVQGPIQGLAKGPCDSLLL